MRRFINILLLLASLVTVWSCFREQFNIPGGDNLPPEGTPVTLTLGFGASDLEDIEVGTKAELSRVDESRIHDLYVLIFDNSSKQKIYGRYFTYEHQYSILKDNDPATAYLLSLSNEGCYV
jgi:hypothetical protein